MSVDCEIHGVPEGIPEAHVAAMLVQWCGTEIATLHTEPTLHVALRGVAGEAEDEWRRGPRGVEVFRPSPRVLWLTLRYADAYTMAIAEGFAVWWARKFGRKNARVQWSTTGRIVWSRSAEAAVDGVPTMLPEALKVAREEGAADMRVRCAELAEAARRTHQRAAQSQSLSAATRDAAVAKANAAWDIADALAGLTLNGHAEVKP